MTEGPSKGILAIWRFAHSGRFATRYHLAIGYYTGVRDFIRQVLHLVFFHTTGFARTAVAEIHPFPRLGS